MDQQWQETREDVRENVLTLYLNIRITSDAVEPSCARCLPGPSMANKRVGGGAQGRNAIAQAGPQRGSRYGRGRPLCTGQERSEVGGLTGRAVFDVVGGGSEVVGGGLVLDERNIGAHVVERGVNRCFGEQGGDDGV